MPLIDKTIRVGEVISDVKPPLVCTVLPDKEQERPGSNESELQEIVPI